MKSICVFCGSSTGSDKIFSSTAEKVGKLFVKEKIDLVYGGGNVGLMGVIAQTMMSGGGKVTGIMPEFLLKKEHATLKITKLVMVKSMHQRKAKMSEYSDGFYMLPGGLGTMEEFFEVWTWAQLDLHRKPIGVLNTAGYYNGLIKFLDMAVSKGFIRKKDRDIIIIDKDPVKLLQKMQKHFVKNHKSKELIKKS